MFQPFLELTYDAETNTARSIYRCGETEEQTIYEGTRNGLVKFTPETWPEYEQKLYGRALPVMVDGYGWIKYVQDAVAIGVPEAVYSQYPLQDKNASAGRKICSIVYERRDYEGNLLERRVVFDQEDAVWLKWSDGTLDVPEGMSAIDFGIAYADKVIAEQRAAENAAQENPATS